MRTTNKQSRDFVSFKRPFKASNLKGQREGNCYIVYSYNWYPIFVYSFITCKWYENKEGYSQSTKRQISQCRPYSNESVYNYVETILLSHEEMKELLTKMSLFPSQMEVVA